MPRFAQNCPGMPKIPRIAKELPRNAQNAQNCPDLCFDMSCWKNSERKFFLGRPVHSSKYVFRSARTRIPLTHVRARPCPLDVQIPWFYTTRLWLYCSIGTICYKTEQNFLSKTFLQSSPRFDLWNCPSAFSNSFASLSILSIIEDIIQEWLVDG